MGVRSLQQKRATWPSVIIVSTCFAMAPWYPSAGANPMLQLSLPNVSDGAPPNPYVTSPDVAYGSSDTESCVSMAIQTRQEGDHKAKSFLDAVVAEPTSRLRSFRCPTRCIAAPGEDGALYVNIDSAPHEAIGGRKTGAVEVALPWGIDCGPSPYFPPHSVYPSPYYEVVLRDMITDPKARAAAGLAPLYVRDYNSDAPAHDPSAPPLANTDIEGLIRLRLITNKYTLLQFGTAR